MGYFNKRYHQPGTPPGTLPAETGHPAAPPAIQLLNYSQGQFAEYATDTLQQRLQQIDRNGITWLHVQGQAAPSLLQDIGTLFSFHPLALEDVHNSVQRPKIETYEDHLFVIMNLPCQQDGRIWFEQLSIFVGPWYVVSFCSGAEHPFHPVIQRLKNGHLNIRSQHTDYLLYCLLDTSIDRIFPLLEGLADTLEQLEEEVITHPTQRTLNRIHQTRRQLMLVRRNLWPQREVINFLMHGGHPLIHEHTMVFLRDCYDHINHSVELGENFRETTSNMLEIYLSSVNQRLNETMRLLTLIATIFIPLTFIVGVYGMNFGNNSTSPWAMPELNWYYGYPLIWGIMLAVTIAMVVYFRRKRWL